MTAKPNTPARTAASMPQPRITLKPTMSSRIGRVGKDYSDRVSDRTDIGR